MGGFSTGLDISSSEEEMDNNVSMISGIPDMTICLTFGAITHRKCSEGFKGSLVDSGQENRLTRFRSQNVKELE